MSNFKDQVPLGPYFSSSYSLTLSLSLFSLINRISKFIYFPLALSLVESHKYTLSFHALNLSNNSNTLSLSLYPLFSFLFNLYVISNTPHTVASKTKLEDGKVRALVFERSLLRLGVVSERLSDNR